jgi:hypothetical protein
MIYTLARLGLLADNGGLTETHAIGSGSPLVEAGNDAVCQTLVGLYGNVDQRGTGFPRRSDGNGDGVVLCDIGAVEAPGVGGGGGGCVAGSGRGVDPLFPLLLAAAGCYWQVRRRRAR